MTHRHSLPNAASALSCGLFILFLGLAKPAAAQEEVVGTSEILLSTSSSEIDTYSATELTYDASLYYDVKVVGYLYQNGAEDVWGWTTAPTEAELYMHAPLHVPDDYELVSDHYVVAFVTCEEGGTDYYNYYQYLLGTDAPPYTSNSEYYGGGGNEYSYEQDIYLGTTTADISSAGPTITSISPAAASVGTSGTITVYGDNLMDPLTETATPAISGSGITLTPNSVGSSQVGLNYSIATNASTGAQSLTLTTRFGTSKPPATFTVGDPTPTITSVSPTQWPAGATTPITITGTGFGTNPTLSIDTTSLIGPPNIVSSSDTQISAQVTIDPNAPDQQNVLLTVTSQGYGGSGFMTTTPQQPSQGTNNTADIVAAAPQILWGTACDSATQIGASMDVVAGQAITLVACLPGNTPVANPSWHLPQNVWITGGYAAGTTTGGQEAPDPLTNLSTLMFYFVDSGGSWPVTVSTGERSTGERSASVTFAVAGPQNVAVDAELTAVQILPNPTLQLGKNANTSPGITFTASATPPAGNAGTFSWVQLQTSDNLTFLMDTGSVQYCVPTTFAKDPAPELDWNYPYATGLTTRDTPNSELDNSWSEAKRSFKATMYLMWTPSAAGNCSGSELVNDFETPARIN